MDAGGPRPRARLRDLGLRGDIIKTMHRASERGADRAKHRRFRHPRRDGSPPPIVDGSSRAACRRTDRKAYAIIDGVDGRAHHLRFPNIEATERRRARRDCRSCGALTDAIGAERSRSRCDPTCSSTIRSRRRARPGSIVVSSNAPRRPSPMRRLRRGGARGDLGPDRPSFRDGPRAAARPACHLCARSSRDAPTSGARRDRRRSSPEKRGCLTGRKPKAQMSPASTAND